MFEPELTARRAPASFSVGSIERREASVQDEYEDLHILGYGIDHHDAVLSLPIWDPVKIVGNVGGIALLAGLAVALAEDRMWARRVRPIAEVEGEEAVRGARPDARIAGESRRRFGVVELDEPLCGGVPPLEDGVSVGELVSGSSTART